VDVKDIYARRFTDQDRAWKATVWQLIWTHVLHVHVAADDVVIDVGAGSCELINAVQAKRRIAFDLNPDVASWAADGVETRVGPAQQLDLPDASVDVAFTSNFLEHLPDKPAVLAVLREVRRVLKPGGKLVLVGPNLRFVSGAYWDYFDHHVPLTDKSVVEALELERFEVLHVEPHFVPYTVKSRLPRVAAFVTAYLKARAVLAPLVGKQFYVVARKPVTAVGA
jgi:ubiquinone/menaquinone biosynthesis C-methylase UbiE